MHSDPIAGPTIVSVFGPEHGFRGDEQAGHAGQDFFIDARTGLPVYSLYGKSVAQIQTAFRNATIDLLVFDIQVMLLDFSMHASIVSLFHL